MDGILRIIRVCTWHTGFGGSAGRVDGRLAYTGPGAGRVEGNTGELFDDDAGTFAAGTSFANNDGY